MAAGYSQTPLARKLGIKPGNTIRLINEPAHYLQLFTDMPAGVTFAHTAAGAKHFIHFFTISAAGLVKVLPALRGEIVQNGMIWVSWPKKAAGIPTDVGEALVRHTGLACGLVDVKVCAVDEVWSGLKFVIPVKDRQ